MIQKNRPLYRTVLNDYTHCALLEVADTGIGMTPETLRTIFERFVQAVRDLARSRGGLGLGLALVRGLAELHGGSVHAWSAGLGQGSTFTIHLPVLERIRVAPLSPT